MIDLFVIKIVKPEGGYEYCVYETFEAALADLEGGDTIFKMPAEAFVLLGKIKYSVNIPFLKESKT